MPRMAQRPEVVARWLGKSQGACHASDRSSSGPSESEDLEGMYSFQKEVVEAVEAVAAAEAKLAAVRLGANGGQGAKI